MAQKKEAWISLFDGKTTKGWHTFGQSTPGDAWKVEEGVLFLDAGSKLGRGDITTDQSFEDFDLKLEWKISKNGNSGIIFFVQDEPTKYENSWFTGPEMQVLDNEGHSDGKIIKHRAGNLYDLIAGPDNVAKPVGEWNQVEIINKKGTLVLKLNGITTASTKLGDDNWKTLIKDSKFSRMDTPDFGKFFTGHICLQDHGDKVSYRNIMIRKL
jgi:hypothetical protein